MTIRKTCAFCGTALTDNRAKEHVFRNSWLKTLGHSKSEVPLNFLSADRLVEQRKPVADQLQAGAVCAKCNGGWMNDADIAVENTVLALSRAQGTEDRPGLDKDISRWLFKTAFAFSLTDRSERRHVSFDTMDALRSGTLPKSYITFVHRTMEQRSIGAASIDGWPEGNASFPLADQKYRFKFGIQYDNVIFGCAYVGWADPTFVLKPGLHQVIEIQGANQRFSDDWDELMLPDHVANTRLNYVVSALGVI